MASSGWIFLGAITFIASLHWRFHTLRQLTIFTEAILLIAAIALFFHYIPGFNNPKILNSVTAGSHSTSFSMYFNLDKALLPFLLLAAYPSLLAAKNSSYKPTSWQWVVLILSIPLLLLVATLLGQLRIERHYPEWLWQFILANLFFTSFAEEVLFRGYLQ